jgi:hypothetical protein
MYANRNFKSKKEFQAAVAAWNSATAVSEDAHCEPVTLFAPGLGAPAVNGTEYVEGPWYPAPHRWYAQVEVRDGIVVKVK